MQPQVLQNCAPPSCSLHGPPTPLSLPPHLTQANTSKSNVLLSNSAQVSSRRLPLHRLRAGSCLGLHARLLHSRLGDAPLTDVGSPLGLPPRRDRLTRSD
ncbi:hypothetical protein D7Y04_32365 [Corallococcus sp. AB038B]|nr:hypothetical protein D7Y04_32365 [Corallococcus sp. AB038B]